MMKQKLRETREVSYPGPSSQRPLMRVYADFTEIFARHEQCIQVEACLYDIRSWKYPPNCESAGVHFVLYF